MKKIVVPILSITIFAIFITGCPPTQKPADFGSELNRNNQTTGNIEESEQEPDRGIDAELEKLAIQFLVKLGFEEGQLKLTFKEVTGSPEQISWTLIYSDDLGELASIIVNEKEKAIETCRFLRYMDQNSPEAVRPGADASSRLFAALGLGDEGFKAKAGGPIPLPFQVFEKIVNINGYNIKTGEVIFIPHRSQDSIEAITIHVVELPKVLNINITEEQAKQIARQKLTDPSSEPTNIRLVAQFVDGISGDVAIYYEVTFNEMPVYVNSDTGEPL